jgi:hypothetical protein
MINYYQPFLLPFLGSKKSIIAGEVKRYYYHSFEDALWDLLIKKHVPKGSRILIPSFYCADVKNNIRLHGYVPQFYPVDKNFQIKESKLTLLIKRQKPSVLILFHACGITNTLVNPSFIARHKDTYIIEDCVHRLVNPATVILFNDNHFVIDSLRKVSPLPGSFIYGTPVGLSFKQQPYHSTTYLFSSLYWYFLFRTIFIVSIILRNSRLAAYAHSAILKRHDDIIGDHMLPQRGLPISSFLSDWINYKKIEDRKIRQVMLYTKLLQSNLRAQAIYYPIHIPKRNYGLLHVFPIGIKHIPHGFIDTLHKHSMAIWLKYEDSPWAKHRHVLFLPLGFHVSEEEIRYEMRILGSVTY